MNIAEQIAPTYSEMRAGGADKQIAVMCSGTCDASKKDSRVAGYAVVLQVLRHSLINAQLAHRDVSVLETA